MAKRLSQMVNIIENNYDCVVLKVKKNQFLNLIALGCFNGDETMFRFTKGRDHTYTVWHGEDNKHYSWFSGESGYTLVSDKISKQGYVIRQAIQEDFGIYIGSDPDKIKETLYKKKPVPKSSKFVAMWFKHHTNILVHRNDEFWKGFSSHDDFINYIKSIGGKIESTSEIYNSPDTGCFLMDYYVLI